MNLHSLDHVNLRTENLKELVEWYCKILGLVEGNRPPFSFPGAWLYLGDKAVIHIVGIKEKLSTKEPKIEHFAFSASGLDSFIDRLEIQNIPFEAIRVPEYKIFQININDSDGNHIHIDFHSKEADALDL